MNSKIIFYGHILEKIMQQDIFAIWKYAMLNSGRQIIIPFCINLFQSNFSLLIGFG